MDDNGNINKAIRFSTDDFKYTADLSLYGGRASFSIFDNGSKGAPVIKMLFNQTSGAQIVFIMNKVLNEKDLRSPIEQSHYPYNRDLKESVFKSSLAIGRDNEGVIFFDFTSDTHKDPIRFYPVTDKGVRINGMELPKVTLTEMSVRAIINVFNVLLKASLYTKDIPFSPNDGGGSGGGFGDPKSNVGDDVPF